MDKTACPPTTGQPVTVEIPDGLPALMMVVAREVMRHNPKDECAAYSVVVDYLSKMAKTQGKDVLSTYNEWTREMIAENMIKTIEQYGVTFESANEAAVLIQKTWKKYKKSVSNLKHGALDTEDHFFSNEIHMEAYEDFNYENDSDMERVNVVKKGQRDYVPPIPDLYSTKYEKNISGRAKEISYEDE